MHARLREHAAEEAPDPHHRAAGADAGDERRRLGAEGTELGEELRSGRAHVGLDVGDLLAHAFGELLQLVRLPLEQQIADLSSDWELNFSKAITKHWTIMWSSEI